MRWKTLINVTPFRQMEIFPAFESPLKAIFVSLATSLHGFYCHGGQAIWVNQIVTSIILPLFRGKLPD